MDDRIGAVADSGGNAEKGFIPSRGVEREGDCHRVSGRQADVTNALDRNLSGGLQDLCQGICRRLGQHTHHRTLDHRSLSLATILSILVVELDGGGDVIGLDCSGDPGESEPGFCLQQPLFERVHYVHLVGMEDASI